MSDTNGATGTDLIPVQWDDPSLFLNSVGTDFLTFAVGSGANVQDQTSYNLNPQRSTGYLPGLATSNFVNKSMRQGTFVAHSLTLWMSQQLTEYIYDDGDDIKWIGEWTRALSAYMLTLIPPGPNLGLYLPLAGGTMSGNINFTSGVTTVLANNTWYRGLDNGGTSRGLILKSTDNNIFINDGSASYVFFNGVPVTNNNLSWSGKDTGGTARPIAGILSDNAVHIGGGSAGNIYLDTAAIGGVYFAGNSIYANNAFINWRDTGGTLRPAIGLNTVNQLVIGSGVTSSTEIYAGSGLLINLHNNTNALAQLTVNQMAYLNGGGRAYIAGANDPFQIYADNGYYARIHYVVGTTRDWSAGCSSPGWYSIADETAHAVRWEIDLSGNAHGYNGLSVAGAFSAGASTVSSFLNNGSGQVNGGLTVYNSLNVASGNLTVSGGTYAYNSLNVWNGLSVNSGGMGVNGFVSLNSGANVANGLNCVSGWMISSQHFQCYADGNFSGGVSVGGCSAFYDDGGNNIACAAVSLWFWNGSLRCGGNGFFGGNVQVNGQINCAPLYANYIRSWGDMEVSGNAVFYNSLSVRGPAYVDGTTQLQGCWVVQSIEPLYQNYSWCGACGHAWYAVASANYVTESDASIKEDIAPIPPICLSLVNAVEPKTFKFRDTGFLDDHGKPMSPDHPMQGTHWGFVYQDVAEVMQDRDRVPSGFAGAYVDEGAVGMLAYNELTAVLWQAVRELSDEVKALKAEIATRH